MHGVGLLVVLDSLRSFTIILLHIKHSSRFKKYKRVGFQTQYISGFLGCLSPLFHAVSLNWTVPEDEILLSP